MRKLFLTIICIMICGSCQSRTGSGPHIELTRVPFTDEGGTAKLDIIEGRVVEATPGQRIVLYARSGDWYIQPYTDQPFTEIQPDSTWRNSTHLGTDYAALLVEPGYSPPLRSSTLPSRGDGVAAVLISRGALFFWQTWWFESLSVLALLLIVAALVRLRMLRIAQQERIRFEERFAERMRIAQELHDTLLQGFLSASFQLHVAAEQLPDNSPVKTQIVHIQQLMGKVIADGRDAVRDLRSSEPDLQDPAKEFLSIRKDLDTGEKVDFRVIVEGPQQPLRPLIWAEVYNIAREALINSFRHAEAKTIEVEVEFGPKHFRLLIRDDGRGIERRILQSGRDGHFGLSGMRERSEKIGGQIKLRSRVGAGTEVEFSVSNQIAFQSGRTRSALGWLTGIYRRPNRLFKERNENDI